MVDCLQKTAEADSWVADLKWNWNKIGMKGPFNVGYDVIITIFSLHAFFGWRSGLHKDVHCFAISETGIICLTISSLFL